MKKILLTLIILLLIPSVFGGFEIYEFKIQANKVEYVQKNITVYSDVYQIYERVFSDFKGSFIKTTKSEYAYPNNPDGKHEFKVKIINHNNEVIEEQIHKEKFFTLSNPITEYNVTIIYASINENSNPKYIQILYKNELIISKEISNITCNNNSVCENQHTGYPNLLENSLNCNDCPMFSRDGICRQVTLSAKNDTKCDFDCPEDVDGECKTIGPQIEENCTDQMKNQDETGIDTGGICGEKLNCRPRNKLFDIFSPGQITYWGINVTDMCFNNTFVEYTCSEEDMLIEASDTCTCKDESTCYQTTPGEVTATTAEEFYEEILKEGNNDSVEILIGETAHYDTWASVELASNTNLNLYSTTTTKDGCDGNAILIGGPCANPCVSQLLNIPMEPGCDFTFIDRYGFGLIQMFDNQLVIAGFMGEDTVDLAKAYKNGEILDLDENTPQLP